MRHPPIRFRQVGGDPVPARFLGVIEKGVGHLHRPPYFRTAFPRSGAIGSDGSRHPEADRHPDLLPSCEDRLSRDALAQPFRNQYRPDHIRIMQHDEEFIPAIPAADILTPEAAQKAPRHRAQHLIPRLMAVQVIDLLEMIDIRHDEGNALPPEACAGKALFRQNPKAAPVREARQHVGQGQVPVFVDEPSVFLQRIADELEVRPDGPQAGKFRRVALRKLLDAQLDRLEPVHDVLQIHGHAAAVFEMDIQPALRDGLRGPAQFVNLEAELPDFLILFGYFVDDAGCASAVVHDPRNDPKELRQRQA